MSIFDRAMSRAAAPAKDSDAGGEGEGARKGTGATAKGAGAEDDDEVGRLMDEAQDDVDKAAAAATAREDADEAAEFGDDIKETADPDAETDDAKLARAKSQRRVSARVRGAGNRPRRRRTRVQARRDPRTTASSRWCPSTRPWRATISSRRI